MQGGQTYNLTRVWEATPEGSRSAAKLGWGHKADFYAERTRTFQV